MSILGYRATCALFGACSLVFGGLWIKASSESEGGRQAFARLENDLTRERDALNALRRQSDELTARLAECSTATKTNAAANELEVSHLRAQLRQLSDSISQQKADATKLNDEHDAKQRTLLDENSKLRSSLEAKAAAEKNIIPPAVAEMEKAFQKIASGAAVGISYNDFHRAISEAQTTFALAERQLDERRRQYFSSVLSKYLDLDKQWSSTFSLPTYAGLQERVIIEESLRRIVSAFESSKGEFYQE